MANLNPCPFCGKEEDPYAMHKGPKIFPFKESIAVYCWSCRSYGPEIFSLSIGVEEAKNKAVKLWNRRMP